MKDKKQPFGERLWDLVTGNKYRTEEVETFLNYRLKTKLLVFAVLALILLISFGIESWKEKQEGEKPIDQVEAIVEGEGFVIVPEDASSLDAGENLQEQAENQGDAAESRQEIGEENVLYETASPFYREEAKGEAGDIETLTVEKDGAYSDKDHVALYIQSYGSLPKNYVTKREAEEAGWNAKEGNLWEVLPGMSIGGDRFGNRENKLPKKKGRSYYECDIDFGMEDEHAGNPRKPHYRGAKRIIYSSDGLIYYTDDHYESFELLYGAP